MPFVRELVDSIVVVCPLWQLQTQAATVRLVLSVITEWSTCVLSCCHTAITMLPF